MKKLKIFIFLLIFAVSSGQAFSATFGDIRLSYLEGDVQINAESTSDWVMASFNVPLHEGDRIWVPEYGKAELHFRNGTAVRFKERTSADILNYDRDSIQLYLNIGALYINYRDNSRNIMQVNTPVATIRAYDRAIFNVETLGNNYTYVSVYRGTVYADYRDGRSVIDEGTKLLIRGYSREEAIPLSSPDAWIRWNLNRDREIYYDYKSTRYLPDELRYYAYDFDRHGRWHYVRDYGYCWVPTIKISAGWAPYRHGRWAWLRGDYVWISYEPWGWTPYHYGRWAFVVNIGWCWVPPARGSVYWGPGYVGWVYTPSYVSWVPLAPYETYYGYGHYGPHSVNLINVNINKIVIKEKYKNAIVRDGVTIVHKDTFLTGRQEKVKIKENPFLAEKIHPGRPEIKPERRTTMPIIKEVPERKLPPREIRETDIRTLKEKAPLQKQRDSQMLDKMGVPRGQENGRIQRDEKIQPSDTKPVIRERGMPDMRRDNLQPSAPQQDFRPEPKRDRGITPQDIKPDRLITPQQDRIRERGTPDMRRDNLQPSAPQQDFRPEPKRDRGITPQDVKPDRLITPQQDRIRERGTPDMRRDNLQPSAPQQDFRPEPKRDRGITPQDIKPDRGIQTAPPQEKSGKDNGRQIKQKEKESSDEKSHSIDEGNIKERGVASPRIR